tara:strand:+ start:92 stop:1027 length:936 start_codon:yes stop_codon:yes gene_type:complete
MKKVFISVLVLATMLTSCSESSNEVNEVMFQETGSIQAVIATAQPATTAARTDVKRGTIYSWVKDVTIVAESTITNYDVNETFDLLDSGDDGFDDANVLFQLNNVALGTNMVTATTTSNVAPVTEYDASGDTSVQSKQNWIHNHIDNTDPYAIYQTDAPVEAEVLQTGTAPISLEMNTQNARLISAVSMNSNSANAEYLTANFTSTSKIEIKEVDGSWVTVGESVITDELYSTFYWSDENSIGGAKYRVTVTVVNNITGLTVAEDDRIVTLTNSTSYRCNFVMNVDDNELFGDVELDLIWQEWIEAPCPGC